MSLKRGYLIFLATFLLLVFSSFIVYAADASLVINTQLNSVDINGKFRLYTESGSSQGFDNNDLQENTGYTNYSSIVSVVSGKELIVDSRPTLEPSIIYMKFSVDGTQSGNLQLSWSYSNSQYPITFTYFGNDSSYTNSTSSFTMSSQSSFSVSNYTGQNLYFRLSVGYTAPSSGGQESSEGSGGGGGCITTNWNLVSPQGACDYSISPTKGISLNQYISNCGNITNRYEDCCTPYKTETSWGECQQSGIVVGVYSNVDSFCKVTNIQNTTSCNYGCIEKWSCQYGECVNGFKAPINCIDANSCGTTFTKPNPLSCNLGGGVGTGDSKNVLKVKDNCEINLECASWSSCEAKASFEDIKSVTPNIIGFQTRKCIDRNGCLSGPYFEEQSCSTKIFLETKDKEFCGQKYIDVYKIGTDYLIARIKDERNLPSKTLKLSFTVDGSAPEVDCNPQTLKEYLLSKFQKIAISSDLRNLVEAIRER